MYPACEKRGQTCALRAQAQERAQAAHARAQHMAAQVPLSDFRRAMGACMAGRGYRIG